MAAPTQLSALHLRGMTDSAGSPGVEIATEAVFYFGDGTLRWTDDAGIQRQARISGTVFATLFEKIFTTSVGPIIGDPVN